MPQVDLFYSPSEELTAYATAAVIGGRLVSISANKRGSISVSGIDVGLDTTAGGGNLSVAHTALGGRPFGVARTDAALGSLVPVIIDGVIPVLAAATIVAGDEIGSNATGQALPSADASLVAGTAYLVGVALANAASGTFAMVQLYRGPRLK